MNPQPTGVIDGTDLILTRTFRAPIEDVWTSITDPASTARWFATWEGDAGEGKVIRWKMTFEKGDAWEEVMIDRCDRPNQLAVTSRGEFAWSLDVRLEQTGDLTKMTFVHKNVDKKMAGEIGPGWEYYLDNLVAARDDTKLPSFDDYYPSQKPYFVAQV
jgi:uncharacterized protein YndB with AHSA1/START domain